MKRIEIEVTEEMYNNITLLANYIDTSIEDLTFEWLERLQKETMQLINKLKEDKNE